MHLVVFAVMVAYVPAIPSAAAAGRWAVLAVTVPLLLWLTPLRSPGGLGHTAGAAFLAWAACSLLWSASSYDTVGALVQLALLAGVFVIGSTQKSLDRCWLGLGWGVAASLPFVLLQRLDFHPVKDVLAGGYHDEAGRLITGLFVSSSPMIEIAAVALVAMVGLRHWRLAAAAGACLALSTGREMWMMLAAAIFVAVAPRVPKRLWLFAMAATAVIGIVSVVWLSQRGSGLNRLEIWQAALAQVSWLGSGFGTFKYLMPYFEFAHNEFLQLAVELGVGSLLLMGVFAYAMLCPRHVLERSVLAAILAAALVWAPFQLPATAMVAALVAGFLCSSHDRSLRLQYASRSIGRQSLQGAGVDSAGALRPLA